MSHQRKTPDTKSLNQQLDNKEKQHHTPTSARKTPLWANSKPVQRESLRINQPHAPQEREAEQIARQVMRSPNLTTNTSSHSESSGTNSLNAPPSVKNTIDRSGQKLDSSTREFMESRFDTDFSDVRVHTDKNASLSAAQIGARAYTVGNDIVFGKGQYQPQSRQGKQLIAHELTHVVQQSKGQTQVQRQAVATTYVEPRAVYIITESVHRVPGLPSIPYTGGQLGPFLIKVQRQVLQLHAVWEPEGDPGLLDALLDATGISEIERHYTGEHRWVNVYSGFRNIVQARGGVEVVEVPNLGLYVYGDDPIPHVRLYGRDDVDFISQGGTGTPTASALYDGSNNRMTILTEDNREALIGGATELPGASRQPGAVIEED